MARARRIVADGGAGAGSTKETNQTNEPGYRLSTPATLTEAGALTAGVTFTDNGDGAAALSGTPAAGAGGMYSLTITASNGIAPDATQAFNPTVNEPPTITSAASTTFTVGAAGSSSVTTGHKYPAATTLTQRGALPAGGDVHA